jgi:hypothetical protein
MLVCLLRSVFLRVSRGVRGELTCCGVGVEDEYLKRSTVECCLLSGDGLAAVRTRGRLKWPENLGYRACLFPLLYS